jgi:hypothetical protein
MRNGLGIDGGDKTMQESNQDQHALRKSIALAGEIGRLASRAETAATDVVARVVPWASPLPTAYLTMRATVQHLDWPLAVGAISGVVIEGLGLASVSTALELREYNVTRRRYPDGWTEEQKRKSRMKVDPRAPFELAAGLIGVYLVSVTALTVALDTLPQLATYAPLIFPVMSVAGVTVLALRADHRRRLEAIAQRGTPRNRPTSAHSGHMPHAQNRRPVDAQQGQVLAYQGAQNGVLDAVNRTRRERKAALMSRLLDAYRDTPDLGATAAARLLGVHRNTVYSYTAELEENGLIRRNGKGYQVLA